MPTASNLTATFTSVQGTVSGWYPSGGPLTITAYDAQGNLLLTQTDPGIAPTNSIWTVSTPEIPELVFNDNNQGGFTLDDITYTAPGDSVVTPEPTPLLLLATGLLGGSLFVLRGARERRLAA